MEETKNKVHPEDIEKLMGYVSKIREYGGLDLFVALFQNDYRILCALKTNGVLHPSVLAELLKTTRPNIAANLRILESKKYIKRTIDSDNRRQVYVEITPLGLRYLSLVDKQCEILFSGWFEILGEEEVRHLFKILELSSQKELYTKELQNFELGE